ncbi:MAG: signal recognition particle-docking protein FtsY, partial [Brachybacterium sp.]|nr:signal recognition particle-docking protein FtsY [Brachybacterium sp.]
MDPDALLALIAGGGGGVLVLGAGAWAYLRSRGRKPPTDDTTGADGAPEDSPGAEAPRATSAVKDRPAAPPWGDTLSA